MLKLEEAEVTPTRVTHGKTFENNEELYKAAHAVDKDLSTSSVTYTTDGAGWLKLEFDRTYFIHNIRIYRVFYTEWYGIDNWCVRSEDNFKFCVNDHNNVDVSVYQGEVKQKSCGTLRLTNGLEQSDQIHTLICDSKGDTVKLSKTTGNIAAYEIAVMAAGTF